ncbi:Imm21 family immunity protein [Streptomyces uncialis]|uniref:Imm21 family immunity protein n=1 Tax=Streptomyces uncialis TaxID=1048205 RepID=UPI002481C1F4|nr:Imm21 family immunity protein [Streptomyces uncialis]
MPVLCHRTLSDCHRSLSGRGPTRLWLPSGVSGGRQTTCFLPEKRVFVRWLAADSEAEVFTAAEAVLADPDTAWEDNGLWVTVAIHAAPSATRAEQPHRCFINDDRGCRVYGRRWTYA